MTSGPSTRTPRGEADREYGENVTTAQTQQITPLIRGDPISTYARVTQRTQTGARRNITLPVRTYLMEAP